MFSAIRVRPNSRLSRNRTGAAAVEFAIVAPILVLFLLGIMETSSLCDRSTTLRAALRQGARLAGMDRDGILGAGQTTNEKVILDVQNFLSACGLPGDRTIVTITDSATGEALDLDAPEAEFALFELTATIPYESYWFPATSSGGPNGEPRGLTRAYVFRNARGAKLCY